MKRMTGLIVLEARDSNPNGDPDQDSRPRQRDDGRGELSPVSFKRKLRDLVEDKSGPIWLEFSKEFPHDKFHVLESRNRDRDEIKKEIAEGVFQKKYWDGRLFGNTFLEEGIKGEHIRTGAVQFGVGVSVAPINVKMLTFTNKAGVEADKDRGMAPMAFKVVEHAVYVLPFFVNPTAAAKSGCTEQDIDLLLKLLPLAYTHTRSLSRSQVEVIAIHTFTHINSLGSISDLKFIDSLTPWKEEEPGKPSTSISEYSLPSWDNIKAPFEGKGIYKNFAL